MADTVSLTESGLRGESAADVARRAYGLGAVSDAAAMEYLLGRGIASSLAVQAALAGAKIYATIGAGLAATAEGGYFAVAGVAGSDTLMTIYGKTAGAAGMVGTLPSGASLQRALNPLAVSTGAILPWEDFDRPEGSAITNGMTSRSGHPFTITGPGAGSARIANNGLIGDDNFYFGMEAAAPITEVWGVLSLQRGNGAVGGQAVLMFNGDGPTTLTGKLIHVEFSQTGDVSPKMTLTGAGNLQPIAGTAVEVGGSQLVSAPAVADGTRYAIGLRFVRKDSFTTSAGDQDELYIHTFDRVLRITGNSDLRKVVDASRWATGQTGGTGAANRFVWHAFQMGPRRSNALRALGGGAVREDMLAIKELSRWFKRRGRVTFTPTAVGWYTIATELPTDSYTLLCGRITIGAKDNAGRHTLLEIGVQLDGSNPAAFFVTPLTGGFGGIHIGKVRLSRSANGTLGKQLDIYIATYVGADVLTVEMSGAMTPVPAPVVGAAPIADYSREQYIPYQDYRGAQQRANSSGASGTNVDFTLVCGRELPLVYLNDATAPARTITLDEASALQDDIWEITSGPGTNAGYNVVSSGAAGTVLKTLPPNSYAKFRRVLGQSRWILWQYHLNS